MASGRDASNPDVRAIALEAMRLPTEQRADYVNRACDGNEEVKKQVYAELGEHEDELAQAFRHAHIELCVPKGNLGPEQRKRGPDAYYEALPLEPSEADAFLKGQCGGDTAGHAFAQRMLEEQPKRDLGAKRLSSNSERTRDASKDRVGPYKLLERIGEGSFGEVYAADQETPVRQRVAVKIIKEGMDTREVIARFEAERQALAMMNHPHIAKVLGAGTTDQGRPYFVMELVRGVPITRYCDDNHLTVRARLELFTQVCHAVQHAHTKGVIHRDIKPGNVLVGTVDGRPDAKVIDFGIAKATDHHLTDKTLYTGFQRMIGTPAYMSPEQVAGTPDIDTRTDVYSLGVLLYELLTGMLPFDSETLLNAGLVGMRRMICEDEPPRPSARLNQLLSATPGAGPGGKSVLDSTARARGTDPTTLLRTVRGELDWIIMHKCLEKDRARRYQSPEALADDIQRYLAGDAVVAAPPSRVYRLRKFVRRHRSLVVVLSSMLLAAIVSVVSLIYGLERSRAAESAARAQAELALHVETARQQMVDEIARFIQEVRALHGSTELSATFAILPPVPRVGDDVTFVAAAAGGTGFYSYVWDLGDGGAGGQTFAKKYTAPGAATVTLTITDTREARARAERTISVVPAATDQFVQPLGLRVHHRPDAKVGEWLTMSAGAKGGHLPYVFEWDFGNGMTGRGSWQVIRYTQEGTYTVRVALRDARGTVVADTWQIEVRDD